MLQRTRPSRLVTYSIPGVLPSYRIRKAESGQSLKHFHEIFFTNTFSKMNLPALLNSVTRGSSFFAILVVIVFVFDCHHCWSNDMYRD